MNSQVSIDRSVKGGVGHVSMVFHATSDGGVGLSNVLFMTNGAFQKIDGMSGVTGVDIGDGEILFGLMTRVMTVFGKLRTSATLCVSTFDVSGWEALMDH